MVVFSAGIRPRDELARDCGLRGRRARRHRRSTTAAARPTRRSTRSASARWRRRPGLRPGRARLRDGRGRRRRDLAGERADLHRRRPVHQAQAARAWTWRSFGDAHGTADGALDVRLRRRPLPAMYKQAGGRRGRRRCSAGCWSATPTAYGALRPLAGCGCRPAAAEHLILPAARRRRRRSAPTRCRTTAGDLLLQQRDARARSARRSPTAAAPTSPAVKECTRAGTGCGSCVPLLKPARRGRAGGRGVEVDNGAVRALRAHPRRAVRDRAGAADLTSSANCSTARHGRGRGCEICKPAVASILASPAATSHILDGEQAALQDTNDHFLANIQRNGTYSVVPRIPGGEITPEKLIVIGEVATGLRPLHQDHRRAADRPVRRPRRAAAADLDAGWSTPASSPATPTARRCAR